MTNKSKLILFSVLSALIVVVGIVMVAILGGYRVATDGSRMEVSYDTVITIAEKEEALEKTCEDVLSARGLKFKSKMKSEILEAESVGETGDHMITYVFSSGANLDTLRSAATQIQDRASSEYADTDIYVTVLASEAKPLGDAAWRGAIALAVAAVVAVIYMGIRYGFASAVAGLISAAAGGLLSAAIFAIIPIPVYSYAPILYAGIGAVFTLFFWMLEAAKLKQTFKENADSVLSAEEAIGKGIRGARKYVLLFAIPIAVTMALLGILATNATRLFFLPALVPLAISIFEAMLFAPCIMIPVKGKTDSMKSTGKYVGKKKADAEE